jgi:hypothetical protein
VGLRIVHPLQDGEVHRPAIQCNDSGNTAHRLLRGSGDEEIRSDASLDRLRGRQDGAVDVNQSLRQEPLVEGLNGRTTIDPITVMQHAGQGGGNSL